MSQASKTITKPEDIHPCLQWAFSAITKGLVAGPVVMTLGRETYYRAMLAQKGKSQ